ncbi:MAG: cobalt-precorrin-6A reductase [Aestuariivirga sp.]|nr:cobalt-precorrin-6A reductase [Aestuariivirga sp.]
MPVKRILVLGGTSDANVLVEELLKAGFDVVTSFAGVTENPVFPEGKIRVGGFGGEEGLYDYLKAEGFAALADATHPFAAQISRHGFNAAERTGIPYLRLERAAWTALPADNWISVQNTEAAIAALPNAARIMLTIGRKEIAAFLAREDLSGVARMIEKPLFELPPNWELVLARPPFSVEAERELLSFHKTTHLVTKNAGGKLTVAKLIAARGLRIPVVMIERPQKPPAPAYGSAPALVAALA